MNYSVSLGLFAYDIPYPQREHSENILRFVVNVVQLINLRGMESSCDSRIVAPGSLLVPTGRKMKSNTLGSLLRYGLLTEMKKNQHAMTRWHESKPCFFIKSFLLV